jgi:hypothetical protein
MVHFLNNLTGYVFIGQILIIILIPVLVYKYRRLCKNFLKQMIIIKSMVVFKFYGIFLQFFL